MRGVALGVLAFVLMEPLTYLAHRYVMHGAGRRFHRSHHRRWPSKAPDDPFLEGNDVFPAVFAAVTIVALAIGFNVDGFGSLIPVCVGVTAYGAAYAFVHDVYVHGRLPVRFRSAALDRLAVAHDLHHRFGGEPYGMLLPVVPAAVRRRAALAVARPRRTAPR
ncbi:MAG TPA: sterol desaturase family protein [Acidimicrobiales bacterium]|nr:sterol desaturase family protein [Acidimicrobiales bacterium]